MIVLDFLKSKGIGWFLSLGACICALVFVIIYGARGGDAGGYSPVSGAVVAMIVIGIVLNVGVLVKDFKVAAFAPYLFYIIAFGILMNTEMAYLSNVGFGVDGSFIDGGFIAMCIFLGLAMAISFAACLISFTKKKAPEDNTKTV